MPVVGQEKTVNYGQGGYYKTGSHYDGGNDFGGDDKYGLDADMGNMDGFAPVTDDRGGQFDDDSGGFGDFGGFSSPFKYHHDVSATDGLKGDSHGFDDEVCTYF